jgi:hypothetical protein
VQTDDDLIYVLNITLGLENLLPKDAIKCGREDSFINQCMHIIC